MTHRNENGEALALVSNIQRYTIHDGPGLRTEIFLKGCNLDCLWCSNPEAISPRQELGVYPAKCVGCGSCVKACPLEGKPISFPLGVERGLCPEGCLRCAEACPGHALKIWGEWMSSGELLRLVERDRGFYNKSGGGVTVSGGEPMLQWEFVREFFEMCRKVEIHTCMESAMNVAWEHLEAVLPLTDFLICDIKNMNSACHRRDTGAGNELILRNIKKAVQMNIPVVIRTPVVPGHNDHPDDIMAIGAFIRDELGGRVQQYQLLPYRKMGTEKLDSLGRSYPLGDDFVPPTRDEWEPRIQALAAMLREEYGINAFPGSAQGMER